VVKSAGERCLGPGKVGNAFTQSTSVLVAFTSLINGA